MEQKKICSDCGESKSVNDFARMRKLSEKRQPYCDVCRKRRAKEFYERNKKLLFDKSEKFRNKQFEEFRDWKNTLKCNICKESESVCLDFHHIDETKKVFDISQKVGKVSLASLNEEIKKCICVCANCHRKVHKYGLVEYLKNRNLSEMQLTIAEIPQHSKKIVNLKYCKNCHAEIYLYSKTNLCEGCYKLYLKNRIPPKPQLSEDLFFLKSQTAIAKKYNVSLSCMRRWLDKYELI